MVRLIRGLILCVWLAGSVVSVSAVPRVGHVFIISIDGGKPDVIRQSDMPVLKGLAAEGAYTWTAQTIFPSITLPSHTSMLTGVGVEKHHILWNTWRPKAGVVQVPTIFAEARQQGFSTAMFVGKEKFRHLLQPGTVDRFDFDLADSGKVISQIVGDSIPVLSETVPARTVANHAAAYIISQRPNLCFIHFTDPDDTGHRFGWGSVQQKKAFADVDAALAEVLKGIKTAGILPDSVLMITADHGGHGKTHGSRMPEDMNIPWVVWGKGVKPRYEILSPLTTCDTAATALWLLNISLPPDLDGKPVTAAFNQTDSNPNLQAREPAPESKYSSVNLARP